MIKVGNIVKFNSWINKNYRIGIVVEVLTIIDSNNKEELNKKIYMVNEEDATIAANRVEEGQIKEVYERVDIDNGVEST